MKCLQSLFLSNPQDDLAAIRSGKGKRTAGTCEWILTQDRYTSWLIGESSQLLWLSGAPGIGKTMISSFLVEELIRSAERSSQMMLAYYFCDDKDEKRRTATSILRGLLLQLLRQRPSLFKHIQSDFSMSGDSLFTNFDALWRILDCILEDPEVGEVYCLIDALDECEKKSRRRFLANFTELFCSQQSKKTVFKFIVTSRRENDIEKSLSAACPAIWNLQVDSGKVNNDLSKFIDVRVDELSSTNEYNPAQKNLIKNALIEKAGGTFLYVSLVVQDLAEAETFSEVRQALQDLPSDLNNIYNRILGQIDAKRQKIAKSVLCWVTGARRPLTVDELAMARAVGTGERRENTMPQKDRVDELKNDFKCCKPLIYVDTESSTVNLVHQSAKDYLLGTYLQGKEDLSQYHIVADSTNLLIFQTCWTYLSLEEFKKYKLHPTPRYEDFLDYHCFLRYASQEWQEHALAASRALITGYEFRSDILDRLPEFRDTWLHRVAAEGQEVVVQRLLENGAELEFRDNYYGRTPLSIAAQNGQEAVVKILLENGAELEFRDNNGWTPLSFAARYGQEAVVKLLLENGAVLEFRDNNGWTPLSFAARYGQEAVVKLLLQNGAEVESKDKHGWTPILMAVQNGHEGLVKLLLQKGVKIESKDRIGWTPLSFAARYGQEAVVKLLLQNGAEVESKDNDGWTPLSFAARYGQEAVVKLLLQNGAEVESKDNDGWTPLSFAARYGQEAVVKLLLQNGAEVESKDNDGRTPLSFAARYGQEAVVKLLLQNGAEVESKDNDGRTPLSFAARYGQEAVVKLLLQNGAEVESKDKHGWTPISMAAKYGKEAVVKLSFQNGAEPKPTISNS